MAQRLAKFFRILTVAPIMALIMLLTLYIKNPSLFGGFADFILSIIFLTIFPILAYPVQPFIKRFKDKGRDGQRTLAMLFAVAGYIGGCIFALILHSPKSMWLIYLSYLVSGILIVVFNKLFRLKASGHACGVTGPFAILIYFGQFIGFLGIPVLALVWWSSLKIKRHTIWQLIGGTLIPLIALKELLFFIFQLQIY